MADITFAQQLGAFATRVGTECKALHTLAGKLADLSTTDKTSLVAAINEIKSAASTLSSSLNSLTTRVGTAESGISTNTGDIKTLQSSVGTLNSSLSSLEGELEALEAAIANATEISDTATSTTKTWSSSKISSELTAAKQAVKNDILGGAGTAYDTLKELADLLITYQSEIEALEALAAGHVKYDAAQTLTDAQKTQARGNIGAASASDMTSVKSRMTAVENKATTNATNHTTLSNNIGDTSTDFVALFEAALTSA